MTKDYRTNQETEHQLSHNKGNRLNALAIILTSVLLLSCAPLPPETNLIKIGAILPLTGSGAYWGQPVLKGMQLAAEEINTPAGVNGRSLDIIVEDSKGAPAEGVTAANKLLTQDVVSIVVHITAVSNAVAPVLEEKKMAFIADAADPGLPLKFSYGFRTFYNGYDECKKLVDQGVTKGMKRYGLLLPNMPWGIGAPKVLPKL